MPDEHKESKQQAAEVKAPASPKAKIEFLLSPDAQDLVLACLCKDADFQSVAHLVLPEFFYGPEAIKTVFAYHEHFEKHGMYPSLPALEAAIEVKYKRPYPDAWGQLRQYLDVLKAKDTRGCGWLKDYVAEFCRLRAYVAVIEIAVGKLKDGEVPENLGRLFDEANQVGRDSAAEDCATVQAPPLPVALVDGIIHCGHKLIIGGSSKSRKTWLLLDLAVSVATGSEWLGRSTGKNTVLYVNFELDSSFFHRRKEAILARRGLKLEPGRLFHLCLRGKSKPLAEMLTMIVAEAKRLDAALVILDPIYKLMLGSGKDKKDENSASDWANLMNELEKMAVTADAAMCTGAHFAKGSAAGKESLDRISGSGVSARDPDTILTLTRCTPNDVFAVEVTARNFPPLAPFCIEWDYPCFELSNHDPEDLKQPKRGVAQKFPDSLWLNPLPTECDEPVPADDYEKAVLALSVRRDPKAEGMSGRTFRDRKAALVKRRLIKKVGNGYVRLSGFLDPGNDGILNPGNGV